MARTATVTRPIPRREKPYSLPSPAGYAFKRQEGVFVSGWSRLWEDKGRK